MNFEVDLFVIGAGSGGVRAARIAAGHGARAMIAEESRIGGLGERRGRGQQRREKKRLEQSRMEGHV